MTTVSLINKTLNIASTFHYKDSDFWEARVHILDLPYIPPNPSHTIWDEIKWFFAVVRAARRERVMLLNCASGKIYPDLLGCVVIGFWPKSWRPLIVLAGPMWDPNTGLRHLIEQIVIRLADRAILRYAVWSSESVEKMPHIWSIDPAKMRRVDYFYTFKPADLAGPEPPPEDYVFAGGNSQRDYDPFIEAARQMPDQPFVIATRILDGRTDLPSNLTARQVPHAEYVRLMRAARAVVIPMRQSMSRSAGQQTYMNAMLLGKPTIVNESFGVHDVIREEENGFIVTGTPDSYVEALRWVLDPSHAADLTRITRTARQDGQQYSYENHLRGLLQVIDEAAADPGTRARCRLGRDDG